jgi:cytochrome c peroxidase
LPFARETSTTSPPAPQKRTRWWAIAAVAVSGAAAVTALPWALPALRRSGEIDTERLASFNPLPQRSLDEGTNPVVDERIRLGRKLFYDARLSKSGGLSCNTCHPLDRYGADGKKTSMGVGDHQLTRNTPSVYNSAAYSTLMWDGRHETLVAQAGGVLTSPQEMGMTEAQVVHVLKTIPAYGESFAKAFPGEQEAVNFHNVLEAIAAFESTLFTRGRWDGFLEGDKTTLTDEEKHGFNLFIDVGCVSCHFGPNIGAMMFQKLGLVKAWPDSRDRGRYEVTKRDLDWMVFRVPSLRNVAMTGPYFHDGSISSLDEAVRIMSRHQIGKELTNAEVKAIVSWLRCLTGDLPQALIAPEPPADGAPAPAPSAATLAPSK